VHSFLTIIENNLKPLLEFIAKPNLIDFDDDLLYCIAAIIKKSKRVSETFMIVFKYLPDLHLKYKGVFGTLL